LIGGAGGYWENTFKKNQSTKIWLLDPATRIRRIKTSVKKQRIGVMIPRILISEGQIFPFFQEAVLRREWSEN
jgi:hypothetical protein